MPCSATPLLLLPIYDAYKLVSDISTDLALDEATELATELAVELVVELARRSARLLSTAID